MNTQAYIHPEAKIGHDVIIEPFTHVSADVEIGERTRIGPNATIMDGARIGKDCQIFPGAIISAPPQDLKYKGEPSTVTIGDDTIIRECVTVNRGTALDKNDTKIGKNSLLMAYVHIAHDCVVGNNVMLANGVQMAGHVIINDYAFVGGAVAIHQFVKIGKHTMISGGCLVRKDVPPFVTAAREPVSYAGVNSIGLRRRGFSNNQIREIQDVYRIFYLSGLNNSQALDKIKLELNPSQERDDIVNFIENSNRGLMRGSFEKEDENHPSGFR